jgi:phosphoenolpyruvate carboxykinase (ATP)
MKLKYTRAMISAALNGELKNVEFSIHNMFGLQMPLNCPEVPAEVLNPRSTWENKEAYDKKAAELANSFKTNFEKFESYANDEIMGGGPVLS